jgi:hypothetical protein
MCLLWSGGLRQGFAARRHVLQEAVATPNPSHARCAPVRRHRTSTSSAQQKGRGAGSDIDDRVHHGLSPQPRTSDQTPDRLSCSRPFRRLSNATLTLARADAYESVRACLRSSSGAIPRAPAGPRGSGPRWSASRRTGPPQTGLRGSGSRRTASRRTGPRGTGPRWSGTVRVEEHEGQPLGPHLCIS